MRAAIGLRNGILLSIPLWAVIIIPAYFLSGCATTPEYEICNTPNCGDNVAVEVSNEAK